MDVDNIANIGRQRDSQLRLARARKAQPVMEKAQIVVYLTGREQSVLIRYTDMSKAIKDYDRLLKAADKGDAISLSTPAMTTVFRKTEEITACYLVDVETNNSLMADTQRRYNAAMQLP